MRPVIMDGITMRDTLHVGDIVIYRTGHSVTVHASDHLHYVCTEQGERRIEGRCDTWKGTCPARTTWGI